MNRVSYKAPAKVILSGEHAVVYGRPALICAISLYTKFTIEESNNEEEHDLYAQLGQKVLQYLKKKSIVHQTRHYKCVASSQIPRSSGLGSSAALSVAASASFLEYFSNRQHDKETINNVAFALEKIFHKNPSGADNSASCFGGIIYFRKEFEFLKTISALQCKIPQKIENHLFLIDSGKPVESTKEMVEMVGKMYNKNSLFVESCFLQIEKCTKRMTVALYKEDATFFKLALMENQKQLEKLGVVSVSAKKLLKSLSNLGVGKITGAGGIKKGSGYVVFYAENPTQFILYAKKNKIPFIALKQSLTGVSKLI